jgi:hypothetical protein
MEGRALRLELRMDASPLLVSVTRRFVEQALETFIDDADLVSRVAMAAHELLENAAKYARQGKAELSIVLDREGAGAGTITVRLCNAAAPAHIDRLREIFSTIHGCDDPLTMYVGLMRRHANDMAISGLGLARIRAEGDMTLALDIDGEVATIAAHATVAAEQLATAG